MMALEDGLLSEPFAKLKKLSRLYMDLQDCEETADVPTALKVQQKLAEVVKLANIVENPELYGEFQYQRRLTKEKEREFKIERGYSIDRQAVLVWHGGKNLSEFIEAALALVPFDDPHLIVKSDLQDAVDACVPGDLIVLCEGDHILEDIGDLQVCLNLTGLSKADKTRVILDSGYGFELVLKNPGSSCRINNVTLMSKRGQAGLWASDGAEIVLTDCILRGFNTGIKLSGSKTLGLFKWSDFVNCQIAIEVDDGAKCDFAGGLIEECEIGLKIRSKEHGLEEAGISIEDVDNYSAKKIDFVQLHVAKEGSISD